MKTPHLDNLINDLKAYDRNDMLSDDGRNQLNEYEAIKRSLSLGDVIKSLPTTEDIEHFASNKRKQDWSVELGNGASEYERGLIFGAKWMKQQIEGNAL